MAGLIVTKKQLVMLIREHGGKASTSDSNAALMRKANALGLGAKKAKPQYLAGAHKAPRKRKAKKRGIDPKVMAAHRAGRITQSQAMKKMGLDPSYIQDRLAFERAECSRNPGPDPYRKDMLILDPGGISYTGPFGPFGQYDPQRRSNPGLPAPGQVVGMGDYMQMNPGMGDYLLEREIAPYESAGSINGLSDYMLLDMTPPAPRKNPTEYWMIVSGTKDGVPFAKKWTGKSGKAIKAKAKKSYPGIRLSFSKAVPVNSYGAH